MQVKKTNPKLSATWTIWEQLVVDKTKASAADCTIIVYDIRYV